VIFRTAALLLLSALPFVPSRDFHGVYSAPAHGHPLCTLKLHVAGFRDNTGTAGGLVFASSAGWPENITDTVVHGGVAIENHQAQLTFQVPPGRYAAVVIHDENSNMKLDRNFLGIPKEGFGFSNNPRVAFSAPPFQSAVVPVACPETELQIRLIYK
jgi:uncharacterized protein (DUF2141 family)